MHLGGVGTAKLTVADVIVERHVLAALLEFASVLHHLGVQVVEVFVRDGIFYHDQAVFVQGSDALFQVA